MPLLRAIATVGGFTLVSRLTGFLRDVLIAAMLGAGPVADAFFVAFKLPNFFRRLTAEGSLTVAFVPLYAGLLETDGPEVAREFAREVLAVLAAGLTAFSAAMILAMPWVMVVLAPGFIDTPERFDLAVEFTRVTFPYLPLISLVALFGGMLNSHDRFAAMASAPILLNLILVAALLTAWATLDGVPGIDREARVEIGVALSWGVAVAGLAQFLWLVEACRREGILPRPAWPRWTKRVAELLRLMGPAMLGAGVIQVNLLIDVILASTLPTGSISFLYYADRVNQLPLGVVGVAIGTALLPAISRQVRRGDDAGAIDTTNRGLEIGLLLTLPAALGLAVLADPIIAVLFERGAFDGIARQAAAAALIAYAAGLPAFVLVKIFQPGFFAAKDTATPVKIAIVAVAINVVLNLLLMQVLAHVGLALATAISSWANAAMLAAVLARRGRFAIDARLRRMAPRLLLAALMMAAVVWLAGDRVSVMLGGDWSGSLRGAGALLGLIALAVVVHFGAAMMLGAANPREMLAALRRPARPVD